MAAPHAGFRGERLPEAGQLPRTHFRFRRCRWTNSGGAGRKRPVRHGFAVTALPRHRFAGIRPLATRVARMLASELMKTLTLAVLATVLAAQPAPEDPGGWRAAKWGMTEEEVLAALPGQAARLPGLHKDGTASVVIEPLIIAGHDFRVTFVPARVGRADPRCGDAHGEEPIGSRFSRSPEGADRAARRARFVTEHAGWTSFAAGREMGFPDDLGRVDPHVQPRHQETP